MADWWDPSEQSLPPELLAAIMAAQQQIDPSGSGLMRQYVSPDGRQFLARAPWDQTGVGEAGGNANTASNWTINENRQGRNGAAYDSTGKYAGNYRSQGPYQDLITALLMMAPAAGGVYGWAGGAAGEAGAGLSGMDLAADAAIGSGNNITTAGAGLTGGGGATGLEGMSGQRTGVGNMEGLSGDATAGQSGLNEMRQGEIGGYQSDPNAVTKAATQGGNMTDFDRFWEGMKQAVGTGAGTDQASWANAASNFLGKNYGGLIGGALGLLDSKDKQQTSKIEPWGRAQPFLGGLLDQGEDLRKRYRDQPISQPEMTGYHNVGNVLDIINSNAGGLLGGFQANASGANQFSRNNPRRGLLGSTFAPTAEQWQPGMFGKYTRG